MKKLFIVALLAIGLTGFAQGGKKKGGQDKMVAELALTAEQQPKFEEIMKEKQTLQKAIKENPEDATAKQSMKGIGKKIKDLLTPEQFEKWQSASKKGKGKGKGKGKKEEKTETEE